MIVYCYTKRVFFLMPPDFMHWEDFVREHKNILGGSLIALVIVSVGFAIHQKDALLGMAATHSRSQASLSPTATSGIADNISTRDSDGDGLPDWEERIYGADPYKSDTDGDGTFDGEEIRLGRDPAKQNTAPEGQAPNDLLKIIQDPHFATSSTDLLGLKKEFFAKYLAAQGQNIRETTYRDLIKGFDAKKITPHNELIDLNISSDNSPEALRKYGNAFGLLINKYKIRTNRTEEEILGDGMETKNNATLRELQIGRAHV